MSKKKKLKNFDVNWLTDLSQVKNFPTIFVANEFFDSLPIKQFIKKNNKWFEKYVDISSKEKKFVKKEVDMKKIERKIGINLERGQKFIEYSPLIFQTIKKISNIINKKKGGLLIIDYGYFGRKMFNTLQSVKEHKKADILRDAGNSDITHLLNYKFIERIARKFKLKVNGLCTQRSFLIKLGIIKRAEIISRNVPFSEKANIYYRLKRLIDIDQMGEIFKVMFISSKKINFKIGF